MTTTTNLAITLIDTNQSQKEVTANNALEAIDSALTGTTDIAVEDGTNVLTAAQVRSAQHFELIDGTPTAAFTVELPAVKRVLVITNATSYEATVVCDGAATGAAEATIAAGVSGVVYCDATQVFGMAISASGSVNFTDLGDVPSSFSGSGGKILAVNSGATAVELKSAREFPLEINAQTGTTYTLVLTDAGKLVTCENVGAITLTVPDNTDVAFAVGTQILISQIGAGQVTFAEDTSVTIVTPETLLLRKQGAQAALVKIATDTWLLEGNLEAA
jgi:hypothetical protein